MNAPGTGQNGAADPVPLPQRADGEGVEADLAAGVPELRVSQALLRSMGELPFSGT